MTDDMHEDDLQLTPKQAKALVERIDVMLPGIKASDERDARLNQAAARRRAGLELAAIEVKADLADALDTLLRHLYEYQGEVNRFMQTHEQMLAYAERASAYAMRDYPRELDNDADVTGLWDAFDRIHTGAHEWRKGAYPYEAAGRIVQSIRRIAEDAIEGRYGHSSTENADDNDAQP
jgi:hypothetical protein